MLILILAMMPLLTLSMLLLILSIQSSLKRKHMKIPDNYLPVMPYLLVKDAYRFLDFAKEIFGATQQYVAPRSEGVIMHAELRIEDAVIMFADATETFHRFPGSMFLYISNVDQVHERVKAAGLKMLQPLENRDYGRGFGFEDDFGNNWWVNTPL